MTDKKKNGGNGQNVGCTVKECRYHTAANCCSARQINVQNETAHQKTETFCATFENRLDL